MWRPRWRRWRAAPPTAERHAAERRTHFVTQTLRVRTETRTTSMRSILLYAIGVPIPIILLLAMCTHHL